MLEVEWSQFCHGWIVAVFSGNGLPYDSNYFTAALQPSVKATLYI